MVDKRKNIKRKLRKLKQLRYRNEVERSHRQSDTGSRSDALISSMEALIRKMSMTPTAAPSTIVSNPSPPTPIQPQIKTEVTKEDIANEIARQRELDMLKNQVHYVYDKMNEDLRTRRSTGETMANMQARGTKLKPKDFGINENDETYKVQLGAAKSKRRQFTLEQHEILDQQEIAQKERAVLHDAVSQSLINKLQNMSTTPLKNNKPSISSSVAFEMNEASSSPPPFKKTPLKLSHLFDSSPRHVETSVFNTDAGKPMIMNTPPRLPRSPLWQQKAKCSTSAYAASVTPMLSPQ
jgi:hypothetical protein